MINVWSAARAFFVAFLRKIDARFAPFGGSLHQHIGGILKRGLIKKQGVFVIAVEEGAVARVHARDGQRRGRDGGSERRCGSGGNAWGHCPAWGDGGKVREDGTARDCNDKPKSKKDADVISSRFYTGKRRERQARFNPDCL